jgi:8-amino-3,8-dideoxy-alpha-D-manno-octulosonate transaminase
MCGSMARIEEIVQICKEHNLLLIEDTAQALGASYKGKAAGTFGQMGCFSFDFFKIITCGEGGAIITNDERLYHLAEQFSDHGHDHIGNNRGMEKHPIIGFNYRIGEINAAIGLAQIRKINFILEKQRKHKATLQASLAKFPQVSFRHIPDPAGDAATFMDFFLPDETTTRAVLQALKDEGLGNFTGIQYWWDNQYHYIRNWEHIRALKTPMKTVAHLLGTPQNYETLQLPQSDNLISRLISLVVKVAWTEEQLHELCQKIEKALASALAKAQV